MRGEDLCLPLVSIAGRLLAMKRPSSRALRSCGLMPAILTLICICFGAGSGMGWSWMSLTGFPSSVTTRAFCVGDMLFVCICV